MTRSTVPICFWPGWRCACYFPLRARRRHAPAHIALCHEDDGSVGLAALVVCVQRVFGGCGVLCACVRRRVGRLGLLFGAAANGPEPPAGWLWPLWPLWPPSPRHAGTSPAAVSHLGHGPKIRLKLKIRGCPSGAIRGRPMGVLRSSPVRSARAIRTGAPRAQELRALWLVPSDPASPRSRPAPPLGWPPGPLPWSDGNRKEQLASGLVWPGLAWRRRSAAVFPAASLSTDRHVAANRPAQAALRYAAMVLLCVHTEQHNAADRAGPSRRPPMY